MKLSEKNLQELKEKKISIEYLDAKYFIGSSDEFRIEFDNILKLLNENICSFKEIVNKCQSIHELDSLLENKEFFEELIQNNLLNTEDLKYLLNKIDKFFELECLCNNTPLIKFVLNEFILNKETAYKLYTRIENDKWRNDKEIHTIFDWIEVYKTHEWDSDAEEYCRKSEIDQELLELIELNKKVYLLNSFDLNKDQKLELIEILKNNDIALNRFKEIVDNNLEHTFDFDALKVYLNKPEKKNILNI